MADEDSWKYVSASGVPYAGWKGVEGLDTSKLSIRSTAPLYSEFTLSGAPTGSIKRQGYDNQLYSGPGGNFSRKMDKGQGIGGWQMEGSNRIINDLGGYLKKGSLQQTGSDFSQEQNMLSGLLSDPSKIQQTAGYQFDVDQGNQAINRSAAARGSLNSGGVLAELAKYGQGMASREYGNQVNRLSSLIGQKQQFGMGSGYYDELNPK